MTHKYYIELKTHEDYIKQQIYIIKEVIVTLEQVLKQHDINELIETSKQLTKYTMILEKLIKTFNRFIKKGE